MRRNHRMLTAAAALTVCVLLAPAQADGTEATGHSVIVTIDPGRIRGAVADANSKVQVFREIPFAKPPVGALRWRPPQPVEPWEGVRDCTRFGPSCLQPPARIVREIGGEKSEDCLYLNVWSAGRRGEKRPVMVWIHGGGFSIGSGAQSVHDGRHFAASGAVLVTINYRLGPFGFMAHPALSAESPHKVSGNYGLLDQIAALKWVRRNIAAFGGDPGNVTIFGESAGGVSVGCLLASPLAKGLFHRAILQSGVGEMTTLRGDGGREKAAEATGVQIASDLGIDPAASDSAETAARLRATPAGKLLETANPRVGLFGKGAKLWPVVDGHVLPRPPADMIAAGQHNDVPVLLGTTAHEGTLFLRQLPVKRPLGYLLLARSLFGEDARGVLEMFPARSAAEVQPALADLVTVSAFIAPVRRTARRLASQRSPVWLYHLTRISPAGEKSGLKATHGVDVLYVFKTLPKLGGFDKTDAAVSETMQSTWLRFARTGNPNGGGLPEWPAYTAENDTHLEFGDRPKLGRSLRREACDLFDEIRARKARRPRMTDASFETR